MIYNIPSEVAFAVAEQESHYRQDAVGPFGEIGIFQLRPTTFPKYSRKQLKDLRTNVKLGIGYLKKMKEVCPTNQDEEYLPCYNAGPRRFQHPQRNRYYKEVTKKVIGGTCRNERYSR